MHCLTLVTQWMGERTQMQSQVEQSELYIKVHYTVHHWYPAHDMHTDMHV